ncbi:hypothetical protein J6590_004854 [Homalodisca vitripennis]|nr:hypothetical protein J6590_004854 [Homalodisca vitripennis]
MRHVCEQELVENLQRVTSNPTQDKALFETSEDEAPRCYYGGQVEEAEMVLLSNRPPVMIIKNTFQGISSFCRSAVRFLPYNRDLSIRSRKRKSLNDQEVQSLPKRPRLML